MSYQRIMLGQGGLRAYIFRDLGCLWSTSCLLIVESLKSGCISFNGKRPSRISSKLIKILVHLFKLSIMFQNNVFCFQAYFNVSKLHFCFESQLSVSTVLILFPQSLCLCFQSNMFPMYVSKLLPRRRFKYFLQAF